MSSFLRFPAHKLWVLEYMLEYRIYVFQEAFNTNIQFSKLALSYWKVNDNSHLWIFLLVSGLYIKERNMYTPYSFIQVYHNFSFYKRLVAWREVRLTRTFLGPRSHDLQKCKETQILPPPFTVRHLFNLFIYITGLIISFFRRSKLPHLELSLLHTRSERKWKFFKK